MKDDVKYTHPSYGVVQFNRISSAGKSRLFGSALPSHHHTIVLRIAEAALMRDGHLHMDRVRAERAIIEVELSAAQFAEMLTTMNMGDGVPCTIRRRDGALVEGPPDLETSHEKVRTDFAAKMANIAAGLDERRKSIVDLLPVSLKASTRRQIEIQLERLAAAVQESAPFALGQFQEAAEKAVNAIKAEADAVLTHMAQVTGIKALREMAANGQTPQLPAHEEREEIQR